MVIDRKIGVRRSMFTAALVGVVAAGGCSDSDVTGPDGSAGLVEAYVEDRSAESAGGAAWASGPARSSGYSGSIDGRASVAISADGETWIDLGPPSSVAVTLQASDGGTQVHSAVEVPAGTYTHVRLVMEDARANLAAGSNLGPITLDASLSVLLGTNGQVTVEKTVPPFEVRAETHTRVSWNLNSHLWLGEEAAEEEEVEEEEVAEAAEPRTEQGPAEEPH